MHARGVSQVPDLDLLSTLEGLMSNTIGNETHANRFRVALFELETLIKTHGTMVSQ